MAECILVDPNSNQKTLLIIGAGIEQVPAYELAKARGLIIVGSDIDRNAPGLALADYQMIASTRDAKETLTAATKFASKHPIDGVMTIANDVPYTVAVVAEALGLPGIPVKTAELFADKTLMKQAFVSSDVPCPWFAPVSDVTELERLISNNTAEQFVIKPVDGRGARGVLIIDRDSDLEWAFNEAQRWGESGRIILEEFIPGIQLSTESFLLGGKAFTPVISERNYEYLDRFAPNIIENGGTIPAVLGNDITEQIYSLIEKGAAALGVKEGVIKGDLIITPEGEPMIIELAARLSGGWLATHQIPKATGVNLVDAVISFALNEEVTTRQLTSKYQRAIAIRYWFPRQGIIKKIQGQDELERAAGLFKYDFFHKLGDLQPKIRMHSDRFGYVMVEGENREEATARVEHALSCISIEVE